MLFACLVGLLAAQRAEPSPPSPTKEIVAPRATDMPVLKQDAFAVMPHRQSKLSPSDPKPPLALRDSTARLRLRHTGATEFTGWLVNQQGMRLDQRARATGNFDGAASEDIGAGAYLLDLIADGKWTISMEQ